MCVCMCVRVYLKDYTHFFVLSMLYLTVLCFSVCLSLRLSSRLLPSDVRYRAESREKVLTDTKDPSILYATKLLSWLP